MTFLSSHVSAEANLQSTPQATSSTIDIGPGKMTRWTSGLLTGGMIAGAILYFESDMSGTIATFDLAGLRSHLSDPSFRTEVLPLALAAGTLSGLVATGGNEIMGIVDGTWFEKMLSRRQIPKRQFRILLTRMAGILSAYGMEAGYWAILNGGLMFVSEKSYLGASAFLAECLNLSFLASGEQFFYVSVAIWVRLLKGKAKSEKAEVLQRRADYFLSAIALSSTVAGKLILTYDSVLAKTLLLTLGSTGATFFAYLHLKELREFRNGQELTPSTIAILLRKKVSTWIGRLSAVKETCRSAFLAKN